MDGNRTPTDAEIADSIRAIVDKAVDRIVDAVFESQIPIRTELNEMRREIEEFKRKVTGGY